MKSWNIAVVGATGQVGRALVTCLEKSNISIDNLLLISSNDDSQESVRFKGQSIFAKKIENINFEECHLAFFVASQSVSMQYAPLAAKSGCIVIDATGYFNQNLAIPIIVPGVNDNVLEHVRHENMISLANPLVCQLLKVIFALADFDSISSINVTNLLPASLAGKNGVTELAGQTAKLLNGLPIESNQQAFNLVTKSQDSDAIIIEQIKRITNNHYLSVTTESIAVPVFYGLTQTVNFTVTSPIKHLEEQSHGVIIDQDNELTPVSLVNSYQDDDKRHIHVMNLRHNEANYEQVQYISIADNVYHLGAKMLVEIAEKLFDEFY